MHVGLMLIYFMCHNEDIWNVCYISGFEMNCVASYFLFLVYVLIESCCNKINMMYVSTCPNTLPLFNLQSIYKSLKRIRSSPRTIYFSMMIYVRIKHLFSFVKYTNKSHGKTMMTPFAKYLTNQICEYQMFKF